MWLVKWMSFRGLSARNVIQLDCDPVVDEGLVSQFLSEKNVEATTLLNIVTTYNLPFYIISICDSIAYSASTTDSLPLYRWF